MLNSRYIPGSSAYSLQCMVNFGISIFRKSLLDPLYTPVYFSKKPQYMPSAAFPRVSSPCVSTTGHPLYSSNVSRASNIRGAGLLRRHIDHLESPVMTLAAAGVEFRVNSFLSSFFCLRFKFPFLHAIFVFSCSSANCVIAPV